jgi:hypothetical protein
MLVLLMVGIYEVRRWNYITRHDVRTKFHEDWFRHLGNIKVFTATVWEAVMLVSLIEAIYEVCHWDGFMRHDILNKFQKIGTGVQAIVFVVGEVTMGWVSSKFFRFPCQFSFSQLFHIQ